MEAERIEEESVRMNQANIAVQIDEANKLKEKLERQRQLKETLDRGEGASAYLTRDAKTLTTRRDISFAFYVVSASCVSYADT